MLGARAIPRFQRYRPPRYTLEGIQDSRIELKLPSTDYIQAKPINFSKQGLAFQVDGVLGKALVDCKKIPQLRFTAFGQTFFDGPAQIRHFRTAEGLSIVGVFTQDKPLKVEQILGLKIGRQIVEGANEVQTVFRNIKISEEFQLLVNQYRDYLLELKQRFDKTEKEIGLFSVEEKKTLEKSILLSVWPSFKEKTDTYLKRITQICWEFKDEELWTYKHYFQTHLHEFILLCPFMQRCVEKPLGYAGDYKIMSMIYDEDRYCGDRLFAKIENQYWTTLSTARATKERMNKIRETIEKVVNEKSKQNREIKITSLGSGPVREIYDFIEKTPLSDQCCFTCVDLDPEALEYSRQTLTQVVERQHRKTKLNFVQANVASYLRSRPQEFMFEQDLIYAAGLYDYLKSSITKKLTETLFPLLRPGGTLALINVSTTNPGRIKVEFGAEWFLIHRTEKEMLDLVSGIDQYSDKKLFLDDKNVYWYIFLKK